MRCRRHARPLPGSRQGGEHLPRRGAGRTGADYSPLWDLDLAEWTPQAVDNRYVSRLIDEFQILGLAERGFLTAPGGEPFGSSGIVINCPIVSRLG